ncbi:UDP-glucose 4-epimerase GalE [Desulfurobacterium atlanticum]|uniref:UDP-glucose 4-epimerase n=1 Tax=Desulfurobacterium atlanticum TaxID=240169 RepID=A0A239A8N3_9BACT|nr:UDP-glucose 4-epimerase GalE [Desulfurobacterium atlanticum]SNR92016.1 UDP-glucose 4-epimerase [Desulfurobacterium atlanticum]
MKIVVTGGAGYIGSHTVKLLTEKNHEVLVIDNLYNGHQEAVKDAQFIRCNIKDTDKLTEIFESFKPDAVIHFAAFIEVGESVKNPLSFYENNVSGTVSLLKAMEITGVDKIIFSSTAAVYGNPVTVPIPETEPIKPINPYGQSKACVEKILNDLSTFKGLNYVSLRYFNAAGADPSGLIGESHNPETHLIPLILKTAKGEREKIYIFGTDYPTPDGTCVRDYIHVNDLADAHLLSLEYLMSGGKSAVFNCGYGKGYSVREIIDTVRKITGKDFRVEETDRRPGDPAVLIADPTNLKKTLNWKPKFDELDIIIKSAWRWELNRRF